MRLYDFTARVKINIQKDYSHLSHFASCISYVFKIQNVTMVFLVRVSHFLPRHSLLGSIFFFFPTKIFICCPVSSGSSLSVSLSPQLVWLQPPFQIIVENSESESVSHSVMSDSLRSHGHSPPGSSIHEFLQARILEWVAMPSSKRSSQPRDTTQASLTVGKFFPFWATRGTPYLKIISPLRAWGWYCAVFFKPFGDRSSYFFVFALL